MRKFPLAVLTVSLALCLGAMADTVTLKDGSTIEGNIIQQDDNQVTISYKFSDTVTDTRILKMSDVSKIEKTPEDDIAFEQIKNLKPDPWRTLAPAGYASAINALNAFLTKYPLSSHAEAVRASLKAFQDEQAHQKAGDVKLFGHWITAAAAAPLDKEVQAQSLYIQMQDASAQGDFIGALNLFDKLERGYAGSRVFPLAIAEAKDVQSKLGGQVNVDSSNLKVKEAQRLQGVAIALEPEKSEMIAAHNDDLARYAAALDTATKSGLKWPPLIPDYDKSLDAIAGALITEKARVAALPADKMSASISETDTAASALAAGDLAAAEPQLKDALLLWPANDEAIAAQKVLNAEKAALAHPTPKPSATPAGPRPMNASVSTNGAPAPAASSTPKPSAIPIS
ncbi:MAG TPA: PTPDL family protein, partial [Chthoniobacteraceae bacterium]|nr:PTPDL family protein [Chthoniobacteraceae bacterium]